MLQFTQFWQKQEEQYRREKERRREENLQLILTRLMPTSTTLEAQGTEGTSDRLLSTQSPSVLMGQGVRKARVQPPLPVEHVVTYRAFTEWMQTRYDYNILLELSRVPQPIQMVQLRQFLSAEMRRKLVHRIKRAIGFFTTNWGCSPRIRDFKGSRKTKQLGDLTSRKWSKDKVKAPTVFTASYRKIFAKAGTRYCTDYQML